MEPAMATALASVAVALVAAGFGYLSARASSKAARDTTASSIEAKRLDQAYERSRAFDTETIHRQDAELEELRADNRQLHERVAVARAEAREARSEARAASAEARDTKLENVKLRERIAVLENHDNNR